MNLIAEDFGDFVTVRIEGVDDCAFTMHKHYRVWGATPEDNRTVWENLCQAAGLDPDNAESQLNALFTENELIDPW